ncbi:MAG: sodium ion-translocating decarboxylase subunit beta [Clostridiales bacterium]|jgi:sodium ion-translocating decarboxylase beta subunit|nr:sodium ion-translocating decarboxylase subunit beta [Clostridiales bacterium]
MIKDAFTGLFNSSGWAQAGWQNYVMIALAFFFLYLAIAKKFEPLLLVGIAFGMLLSNLPIDPTSSPIYTPELWSGQTVDYQKVFSQGGLLDMLYVGVKTGVYPCIIFMGVGAMSDFGPLLSNPKSLLLGAAAQLGIFTAFILAIVLGFSGQEAASIAIIGGADGPTAIWLTKELAPHILGPIVIAAYSYMALIPMIQPPIMKALTTKKERMVEMKPTRVVSQREKILFPIVSATFICLILPSVTPLVGSLMFGNLLKECKVTERLNDTVQNAFMNIVTICLGLSVGATTHWASFLTVNTIKIVALGLFAFAFSTVGGVLMGKLMYIATKGKINPLIGSAGVSAVPMAARVSHKVGLEYNPKNYLLMHAMGPNIAGVIGSAVAAGILMSVFG